MQYVSIGLSHLVIYFPWIIANQIVPLTRLGAFQKLSAKFYSDNLK